MIKKIAYIFFIISIIFTFVSCDLNNIPAELSKVEYEEYKYLQQNMKEIDITDNSFAALADFNESVKDYNLFFVGENHYVAKNYDIQFYLLKNFVENHGVRYILLEYGFANGQYLNMYLESGDTSILDDVNMLGAYMSKESYEFYVKVYEYNKTLPEDKKLMFVGIDISQLLITGISYLHEILPEQSVPKELKTLNKLREIELNEDITRQQLIEILKIVLEEIENNIDIYNLYFKKETFNFKFMLENILQMDDLISDYTASSEKREDYIRGNFVTLYEHYNKAKYFGIYGSTHLEQSPTINNFASFIDNEYEATKGKALYIIPVYHNCKYYTRDGRTADVSGVAKLSTLELLSESDFTLFNIADNDKFIAENKNLNKLLNYRHYILFIQNSPAITKLK